MNAFGDMFMKRAEDSSRGKDGSAPDNDKKEEGLSEKPQDETPGKEQKENPADEKSKKTRKPFFGRTFSPFKKKEKKPAEKPQQDTPGKDQKDGPVEEKPKKTRKPFFGRTFSPFKKKEKKPSEKPQQDAPGKDRKDSLLKEDTEEGPKSLFRKILGPAKIKEKVPGQELNRAQKALSGKRHLASRKRSLLKPVVMLVLLVILLAAAVFGLGPRYAPGLMDKIDKFKILEILKLKKPGPKGLITPEEEMVEELVTVRTYRVARGDFVDILPGMGTVKGDREVELRFSTNGIVDSINFFEGDLVRKGDIIATLDQKDALLKLEYAKSKLKTQEIAEAVAKKKQEIHQQLYDKGIIIQAKLDEINLEYEGAQSQVKSSQKEVEFALAELDKTYLYSPIDGVLGTKDAEVGEFVNSNIKIASLYDTATVVAEMGVIEKDVSRVALGQNAKVNVDSYPGVDFTGKIENIAPIIEGKSRTLTVKVRIKNNNPKGTLLPGMFARIWASVYEKKDTIKAPSSCLYDLDNDGEFDSVYVAGEDNIAKVRPVKIGYISTDYVEIVDGLQEGEQIVSEAMAELKDGVKVDVIEVQEAMF